MDSVMKKMLKPFAAKKWLRVGLWSISAGLLSFSSSTLADVLRLKENYPQSYVVKKGDTLWDISAHYLHSPWRWPELWGVNPQIKNPHLIYPGERLNLVYINGQPRLTRKPMKVKTISGRIESKNQAIPAIDQNLIQPYLHQARVVEKHLLDDPSIILAGKNESVYFSAPQTIYVEGEYEVGTKVGLYTLGREFVRQINNEHLGQELTLTGVAQINASGPVSTAEIITSYQEITAGNIVMPLESGAFISAQFMPKAAPIIDSAKILASSDKLTEMGKFDVVYIDRGEVDGVTHGDVFSVSRDGADVIINPQGKPVAMKDRNRFDDAMAQFSTAEVYRLPSTYNGQVMVFKVYDKTSLGLILVSENPIRVNDRLARPTSVLK